MDKKCLFSARVVEAATPPADGSDTSCALLLSTAMLAMVSDGAITLYYSPLYWLARVHVEGLREMSGHCEPRAFADLNLPPTPAGLAKNIMARFMAQSLVLPLSSCGGHENERMKMRADQVSTASSCQDDRAHRFTDRPEQRAVRQRLHNFGRGPICTSST